MGVCACAQRHILCKSLVKILSQNEAYFLVPPCSSVHLHAMAPSISLPTSPINLYTDTHR